MALTEAQKRQAERNRKYWADREAEQLKHYVKDEAKYDKEIKRIYTETLDNVQKEIDGFYGKYAAKEGITLAEAKKRVSQLDIAAYERKAERYVKDKDFSPKANEEMRLYNATMKINRLELLKANIGLELISGTEELNKYMEGILQGRTEEELKRQAGILGKTIKNNAAKAHAIVNSSFHNATFSDRIWLYQDLLRNDLNGLLQSGLIQGKNPRLLARDIKKKFDTSTYNAERLMRTELARVQTEAQKQSFERNGFTEYEFIVNGGCCDICAALSGKHFKVDKMMPGENAPPMHPHCRCSTAAYEDSEEYNAWLDYLDKGGTTAYWDKLSPEMKAAFKQPLTNSAKSDIISTPKKSNDDKYNSLLDILQRNGVEYRAVEKHTKKLTQEAIINALAGGDNTQGSCASVGLAYIGQKLGLKVLDFRDGASRRTYASSLNLNTLAQMKGIKALRADGASSLTVGNRLLKQCETGKEYYLCTGRHAAIVRKTDDGKLQYLELQSALRSGWTDFDSKPRYTLQHRFGCNSASSGAAFYDFMIDIDDSDFTSDDFKTLLGFINTAENEQRKGKNGTIK
jgi:SPP1 gp7 family putative phage head morphogenesis protein